MFYKSLPMTGFEPRISGVGGDCSTKWATTTALTQFFWLNYLSIPNLDSKSKDIFKPHYQYNDKVYH